MLTQGLGTRALFPRVLTVCFVAGWAALVLAPAVPVRAQAAKADAYKWETVDPAYDNRTYVTSQRVIKTDVLLGRASLTAQQAAFDNWYQKYVFRAMASRDHLGELADNRDGLAKDLRMVEDNNLHQYLMNMVYRQMTQYAQGNHHPAVIYNALLVIGDLNTTEARQVGNDRYPPVPLAQGLDFLVAELVKPGASDVAMLAAMIGIERHLMLGRQPSAPQPIPDAKKAEIASAVLALLQQKDPPASRTLDAHTWLRRHAVDALAELGQVGTNRDYFNQVVSLVDDPDTQLSLRCTAAQSLDRFNYTDVTGIDPIAVSHQLGTLAAYACRLEDARVKDVLEENPMAGKPAPEMGGMGGMPGMSGPPGLGMPGPMLGGPGMSGPGMMSGPGSSPPSAGARANDKKEVDPYIQESRRRLKEPLRCVLLGLRGELRTRTFTSGGQNPPAGGVTGLAQDDAQKAQIENIVTAIDGIVEATDDYDKGLEAMMRQVREKLKDLETLLPASARTRPGGKDTPEAAADDALPGADLPGAAAPGPEAPAPDPAAPAKKAPGKQGG